MVTAYTCGIRSVCVCERERESALHVEVFLGPKVLTAKRESGRPVMCVTGFFSTEPSKIMDQALMMHSPIWA